MNKGTSRETRKSIVLRDDYISVDERSILDMVQFTLDFSQSLNFYSLQNKVIDNWKSFLLHDPAFVIAMIATTDLKKFKRAEYATDELTDMNSEAEKKKSDIDQILKLIAYWAELLRKTTYKGFLTREIAKLELYSDEIKNTILEPGINPEILKEIYENIYGNIVFIREKAAKKFEEEVAGQSNHHPHVGLLLAFFKLLKNAQGDINTLLRKHLDFYYLNLLQQQRKKLKPGSAIVALQLQKGTEELTLNEGDRFEFLLENKQQIAFKVSITTPINTAEISEIRTLYKSDYQPFSLNYEDDDFSINLIYEAEFQNKSSNPEVPFKEYYPVVLGDAPEHDTSTAGKIELSELGLVVSSPALILEKGKQEISLTFKITPDSYQHSLQMFDGLINKEIEFGKQDQSEKEKIKKGIISRFFSTAFILFITNNDGWKKVSHFKSRMLESDSELIIDIDLSETNDKLVSFNPEIHPGGFNSQWPCVKLLLNNEAQYHPYQFLRDLIIENISIKAQVSDAGNLQLSNTAGNLDNSIPFTPFGPSPVAGSFLRIQNPLILQKNLDKLEFAIRWNGLPSAGKGFTDYYKAYPYNLDNKAFKAKITQTRTNSLASENQHHQIFDLFDSSGEYLLNENKIQVDLKSLNFNPINQTGINTEDNASQLFIILTHPEVAFGHQIFSNLYAQAALKSSKFKRNPVELPNLPYTPVIEHLSVSYINAAKEMMMRKQENNSGSDIQLIQIHPFGYVQVFPGPVKSQCFLLPQIDHKGNLFIALERVKPGDVVSIGFDLIPAVYVSTVIDVPKIKWEYLLNNEWESFDELILEDSTDGLIKSGIVKIEIPQSTQLDNTRLPKGKFWIRAVYDGKENLNSRIRNIFTQAVLLTADDLPTEFQEIESGNKVRKINLEGKNGIGNISGPYSFVLNEPIETEDSFYFRVSEQMRHKNRVVSNWDVERIILDKFKNLEKVRVYGRNSHPRELVKGSSMQIVLIPKNALNDSTHSRSNMVDFSTLLEVKTYITQFVSPYVKVEVSNPVYEELKVRCSVKFKDIQKRGHFKNMLNQDLISYLSPDIKSSFIEKGFDESISKTEILNFIENRPYIEFATQLSVLQIVKVGNQYKIIDTARIDRIEELRTISPYAILTSAPEHQIEIISDEVPLDAEVSGIGDFNIESDFIISDGEGNYN